MSNYFRGSSMGYKGYGVYHAYNRGLSLIDPTKVPERLEKCAMAHFFSPLFILTFPKSQAKENNYR